MKSWQQERSMGMLCFGCLLNSAAPVRPALMFTELLPAAAL
jgi:hypothetical protein